MRATANKKVGNTNHPIVDYVNDVNRKISNDAIEFSQGANFYVMETASGSRAFLITNQEREQLEESNKGCKFYLRDEIKRGEVLKLIDEFSSDGVNLSLDVFKLNENNDLVFSACILHFIGLDNISLSLLKSAFFNESMKLGQLHFVYHSSKVAERLKQRVNSSQPRNRNYAMAIKIIRDTWDLYPAASKNEMCSKLHLHFKGTVSKDTIKRWIKKSNLQPPKPAKYTAFSLVIDSD
ncbi:hypothetical protein E3N32_07975 [Salmonella enterica]|nr:hypothetical protein [Salmonella enterica]